MKTKLYVLWIKLQANYLPWTKLYKYRVEEWRRMKWQHDFLKGYWARGHYRNLNVKEQEEDLKRYEQQP